MQLNASVFETSATSAMEVVHWPAVNAPVPDDSAGAAIPAVTAATTATSAPNTAATAAAATTATATEYAPHVVHDRSHVVRDFFVDGTRLGAVQPATDRINHVLEVL